MFPTLNIEIKQSMSRKSAHRAPFNNSKLCIMHARSPSLLLFHHFSSRAPSFCLRFCLTDALDLKPVSVQVETLSCCGQGQGSMED